MSRTAKELIILVGMPGAGKTTYCKGTLPDYVRVSQDDGPRNYRGILHRLADLVGRGVSRIVVDRTNPMRHQRDEFVSLAHGAGYRVKIVYFAVPEETCRERILLRPTHPTLKADRIEKTMASYRSNLTVPTAEECDELVMMQ